MPKRTRSHELEDLSLNRFNDLLPSKWVSRAKMPDYGIDREVEIFTDDSTSTGLMFLVQLRATDHETRGNIVRLEIDELKYFQQLELPVLVARYSSASNKFYCQWAARIFSNVKIGPSQKSVSYRFDDTETWNHLTSVSIRRALEVRRGLAHFPANAAVPVRFNFEKLPSNMHYPLERAMDEAIAPCAGALIRSRTEQLVEFVVTPEKDFLTVQIDSVTAFTFDIPEADPEALVTSTLYAITCLLARKRLTRQAEVVGRAILALGRPHHNEYLALCACQTLALDVISFVKMAILNNFHDPSKPNYPTILLNIFRSPENDMKDIAADMFFAIALNAAKQKSQSTLASVYYSIGNYYRKSGQLAKSVRNYNMARRKRPAYIKTDYFLSELAGTLFLGRRFAFSVKAYEAAYTMKPSPFLAFLSGDALFMSGKIEDARQRFEEARTKSSDQRILAEANLKYLVCNWIIDKFCAGQLPRKITEAESVMHFEDMKNVDLFRNIIFQIDGLNPLAHFNVGVHESGIKNHNDALGHFLIAAFAYPNDIEAWINAAISSISINSTEMITATLSVAIACAGPKIYDRLRAELISQQASEEIIELLDKIVLELIEDKNASAEKGVTMRILHGDKYEAMVL